jgi:hypothetical protein
MKEHGYGQLKHSDKAWGHARETGAPPIAKSHERAHSKNTLDQAKPGATLGHKVAQKGKRGSNSPKE